MLLSAILALGIHACLLWADFGPIGRRPPFKPESRRVILTLVSLSAPKEAPASKPLKLSSPPASEPPPRMERPLSPPPPAPGPEPKLKREPRAEPEPVPLPAPEIETAPPPPQMQTPSLFIPEIQPVPGSPAEPVIGGQKPDIPAAVPAPEPKPQAVLKTDNRETAGPAEPVEPSLPEPLVREARPRYRDNPPPLYPALARKRGHQGTVVLDVFIDKNGRVADARVFASSGYASLDKAARNTVENWLFEPGMRGEEKIEMWVKVPIRFELQ